MTTDNVLDMALIREGCRMIEKIRAAHTPKLIEAQMHWYPASVIVHLHDASKWSYELPKAETTWFVELWDKYEKPRHPGCDQNQLNLRRSEYINDLINRSLTSAARSMALCLQHQIGIFYTVGKYRGFRYGLEGGDYISGFGIN